MDHVMSRPSASRADRDAWAEPGVEDLGGGLYRIPLPLPGDSLKAVNVYAIAGDDGVDLIDAGMALVQARERLTGALGQLGFGLGDIRNFFITHIHQDHYTLAVELRTTLRGQIMLGEGERINMEAIRAVAAGREPGFIEMLHAMGADTLAEQIRAIMAPRLADPWPRLQWSDPDRWLADGAVLDLRSRTLRAIHTPGHTQGHVVFHDEAGATLFAGDHVLPHITPSIGFQPAITPMALRDYLGSLQLMMGLPDSRLLPAHGPVCESTHERVSELLAHHETRLEQTRDAASAGPVTAYQAASAIPWTRRQRKFADLEPFNQLLAVGETAAHLEVLVIRGQLARHTSGEGIDTYALSPPPPPAVPLA
ncbi:MBL fold metallo-hydrolase [Trebonia sp.]|uniref:MBL fold metallo-hydrolase n=1 Tax=Trebonia sp. TaxID=2767075 RepID=UPI002623B5F0|nr:MBL fold metallo-hydrolase [Trebonia sp.]